MHRFTFTPNPRQKVCILEVDDLNTLPPQTAELQDWVTSSVHTRQNEARPLMLAGLGKSVWSNDMFKHTSCTPAWGVAWVGSELKVTH